MDLAFFVGGVIALVLMLVWIGALIWAAIQDGRVKRP